MTVDAYEQHEEAFEEWRGGHVAKPTSSRIQVSDHALLRYLERACGLPIEAMREELAGVLDSIMPAGVEMVDRDGLRFVVRAGTLVTVYIPRRHKRTARTAVETGHV